MNVDNHNNYWENFLFGIFTTELYLDTHIEEIAEAELGFVIPSDRALELIQGAAVGLMGVWPSEAIFNQFENEVSRTLASLFNFKERLTYLIRMRYRFQRTFDLLPIYEQILPKLFDVSAKYNDPGDLACYSRIYQFSDLIGQVKKTIDEKYDTEIAVEAMLNSESTGEVAEGLSIQKLKDGLYRIGFNSLEKVGYLDSSKEENLYKLLATKDVPYKIAMFKYLGLVDTLQKTNTQTKVNETLASLIGANPRTVKGNLLVLIPGSTENRNRYSAHLHIAQVEKDYTLL